MSDDIPPSGTFTPAITFWTRIWQVQIEQTLKFWAAWAQFLPHDSARALAEEAEHMKPAIPRTVPDRPAAAKASATVTEIKSPRKPAAKVKPERAEPETAVPETPKAATAPAKKAPRTPVRTRKAGDATKPVIH